MRVPTLHIRNLPEDVYLKLKARAAREGRSLNQEAIAALRASVADTRSVEEVLESIRRRRERNPWPADAPPPEELIRQDRDSH